MSTETGNYSVVFEFNNIMGCPVQKFKMTTGCKQMQGLSLWPNQAVEGQNFYYSAVIQSLIATNFMTVFTKLYPGHWLIEINVTFSLQASIEVLLKFVLGKYTGKAAHGKKKGRVGSVLKRPVICICNDIYVPALRSLRQIALIVHFPPTASSRLALLL